MSDNKNLRVEKPSEKKVPSIGRILFIAIIVFLAFLMVGGTFFYIFSPGMNDKSNAFGFYDGKAVVLESGNVFGRTLMADENYTNAIESNNYTQLYQSFYNAYQSQVVFDELDAEARAAKIDSPTPVVNKVIIDSGVYNGDDGRFSIDRYNNILPAERQAFFSYVKLITPYQIVESDYESVLVPQAEKDFVSSLNNSTHSFEYFNVNYGVYPDDLASSYIESNEHLFEKLDLSIISCTTEEKAREAYEALSAKSWNEVVAEYSEDQYAENDGDFGTAIYGNVLASNISDNADMMMIRALLPDTWTEPIQGPYSWAIYRLNSPVEKSVSTDTDTLYYAKSLINATDPDSVKPYIEVAQTSITNYIAENPDVDFHEIERLFGVSVNLVEASVYNPAGSQFMADISYVDMAGQLASAVASDKDLYKNLYTAEEGKVFGPVSLSDGTVIFVKVLASDPSVTLAYTMSELYEQYAPLLTSYDAREAILLSPKHENKFTEKFLEMILPGIPSSSESAGSASDEASSGAGADAAQDV